MDFDYQWLLLGLPIAFAFGWLASRFDVRQWKREQRDSPKAYFKGLNLLLNEQHISLVRRVAQTYHLLSKGAVVESGALENLTDDQLKRHVAV